MNVTLTGNLLKGGRLLGTGAVLEVQDTEGQALIKRGVALAVTSAPAAQTQPTPSDTQAPAARPRRKSR